MKRLAIGSALLLVLLLSGPAAQACGFICTEVSPNCWGCEWIGGESGCRQVSACMCQDEICWSPSTTQEKASTPEAFGIFPPTPEGVPMSVAKPAPTR